MDFNNKNSTSCIPQVVGGQDITALRAIFDENDENIIVTADRQVFYYSAKTCEEVGQASIPCDTIVACDKLFDYLYVFTNNGKIFVFNLESRDCFNELSLPLDSQHSLISCRMLSKRQYIYSVFDKETGKTTLNYSMSRSERERPKRMQIINECTNGDQISFDIGFMGTINDNQRCLAYIREDCVFIQQLGINEKLNVQNMKQKTNAKFTCVRVNHQKEMIATGDDSGRIYLFTGDFTKDKFNRTKLHWHSLPVNDLCFSSTGLTLFSVGGESGCVVIWDLTQNNLGQKRIIAHLGMPIRHISCGSSLNQLVLSFEDNEIQFMDTDNSTRPLKSFTRQTLGMYKKANPKALRTTSNFNGQPDDSSVGLLWHSKTDTVVTNARTGWLQFYSPKAKSRYQALNFLKSNILTVEAENRVIPSDITRATLTLDGNWLAFYETCDSEETFPVVKLHIWQHSIAKNQWMWIQTVDRLHNSTSIADLRFSPDGHYLISVCEDGTFHVLHRVCFDSKSAYDEPKTTSKQMYAKGFVGNVPVGLPAMATFSRDSSVMAMSLKNDTTLIWMIVDPYKLVYECQLSQIEVIELVSAPDSNNSVPQLFHHVLGLHFGYHKPAQSLAPLCEVRSNSIKVWNILNSHETMEYSAATTAQDDSQNVEFTAAAFDQCPVFRLQVTPTTRNLEPLISIDGTLQFTNPGSRSIYTHMCFLSNPILEINPLCLTDPEMVKLLNRLCLMNNRQELVSITDKLTFDRQSANSSCNAIKTYDISELQAYLAKSKSIYHEEAKEIIKSDNFNTIKLTEKQKKIRSRLDVQKMLKDLLLRIPSQNLPKMEVLGPMILDKLN